MWLTDRLGFGKVMVLGTCITHVSTSECNSRCCLLIGSIAQIAGYCFEAPAPPFPVFVIGYALNGFGLSLQVRPNYHFA